MVVILTTVINVYNNQVAALKGSLFYLFIMKVIIYRSFLCFLFVISLLSCRQTNKYTNSDVDVININVDNISEYIDLSPIIEDNATIVQLETTDDCLISEIKKVVYHSDNLFVSDKLNQKIYRFSSSGSFLNSIGKIGNGPGEYVSLGDFNIIDSYVYIHDRDINKIKRYSFDGGYIDDVYFESQIFFNEFIDIEDNLYLVTNNRESDLGRYNLYQIENYRGKHPHITEYLPFDSSISDNQRKWGLRNYICKSGNTALMTFSNNGNIIYEITNNSITPKYQITFSKRSIPKEEIEKGGMNAMLAAMEKGYILGINKMYTSSRYLFLSYSDGSNVREVLYDKDSGNATIASWIFIDKFGQVYATNHSVHNDRFIVVQSAFMFQSLWESTYSEGVYEDMMYKDQMQSIYNSITEEDNPVVFLFNLK